MVDFGISERLNGRVRPSSGSRSKKNVGRYGSERGFAAFALGDKDEQGVLVVASHNWRAVGRAAEAWTSYRI
jgi:hypothetical protein